jgi:solute:Na+ symporter, SSS family
VRILDGVRGFGAGTIAGEIADPHERDDPRMAAMTLASTGFTTFDWAVLVGYFVLLAISGWYFSRKVPEGSHEYFLAGRQMPMWAVAISVLATSTSAATFIGAPEQTFSGDYSYLSSNIGTIIAVFIVAIFFIPAFYRYNCTTVYDAVALRFGPKAREATSWAFMVGRVFASGSRLFMAAIPLSLILFRETQDWQLLTAIGVLVVVGTLYTLVGGIRSIIWTDVIQTIVFVGAALAALVVLIHKIPVGLGTIWETLAATPAGRAGDGGNKLSVLKFSLDPSQAFTLWTALIGFTLQGVAAYGTDHDLAQRMLTCKNAVKGSQSVIVATAIGLPVTILFMALGSLLWIFYMKPELMGAAAPAEGVNQGQKAFLTFILAEMPSGMSGLMMAGLFAAGLGSFNSALNAMSATFVSDVYRRKVREKSEKHYLFVGRLAVVGWGVVMGGFAAVCVYWQKNSGQNLIDFALGVMAFAYAGMLAVFFCALFTRRGNGTTAIAALITGFVAVGVMQPLVWRLIASLWTPAGEVPQALGLAFPWQLTIATGLATAVCLLGTSNNTVRLRREATEPA